MLRHSIQMLPALNTIFTCLLALSTLLSSTGLVFSIHHCSGRAESEVALLAETGQCATLQQVPTCCQPKKDLQQQSCCSTDYQVFQSEQDLFLKDVEQAKLLLAFVPFVQLPYPLQGISALPVSVPIPDASPPAAPDPQALLQVFRT